MTATKKVVLVWDKGSGFAFISAAASDPEAPEWSSKGPFITPTAVVKAA